MKTVFKFYSVIWAILFLAFLLISILSTGWEGIEKYTPSFWTGFASILISFVLQLGCAFKAFGTDDAQKFFYNIPLIRISYSGLIATFVFGGLCMFLSLLWGWVAAIVCIIVVAITVLALLKSGAAGEIVSEIDDKIKAETQFIKSLSVDAEMLAKYEEDAEIKKVFFSLAEKIRYSDPVSYPALSDIEDEILCKFSELKTSENKIEDAKKIELLLEERNKKCKLMK